VDAECGRGIYKKFMKKSFFILPFLCMALNGNSQIHTVEQAKNIADSFVSDAVFLKIHDKKRQAECSGSIIAEDWILTAAHCAKYCLQDICHAAISRAQDGLIQSYNVGNIYRGRDIFIKGEVLDVLDYIAQNPDKEDPDYAKEVLVNDIALIKIKGLKPTKNKILTEINDSFANDDYTIFITILNSNNGLSYEGTIFKPPLYWHDGMLEANMEPIAGYSGSVVYSIKDEIVGVISVGGKETVAITPVNKENLTYIANIIEGNR
jgi:hypothetical protein